MNRIFLVVVVVAAVVAAVLWSRADDGLRPEPVEPGTASAVIDGEAASVTTAAVDVESPVEENDADTESFLRAAAGETEVEAEGRPLVVQVWLQQKGVPASGAEVFVVEGSDETKERSENPFAGHISALAETEGQRFEADEQGRVELPPVREWAILAARTPGTFGSEVIGRKHPAVVTITLQADETVTVRVVDAEGAGVPDVPVGIVQHAPRRAGRERAMRNLANLERGMKDLWEWMQQNPQQAERGRQKLQAMKAEYGRVQARLDGKGKKVDGGEKWRAAIAARKARVQASQELLETRPELRARRRTDDRGFAVIRHFQIYRNDGDEFWPEAQRDCFEAVLLMPLARPESRPFAGRPVPEEVLELRMPATGSLALRTVDRDGRPFSHPVHAELRIDAENAVRWSQLGARKEQNEAAIVFPFVGLDLLFRASCRLDDDDFRWQTPQFAGPKVAGERVEVDLVVAPDAGMLFGRLLDAAGEPLRDEEVTFLINSVAGRIEGEEVRLDDDGRFHLPYEVQGPHRPPFRLQIRRPGVVPVAGRALPLAQLPTAHVTDLGDVQIGNFAVVAHGTVVDDAGAPIPGAHVQLERERVVDSESGRTDFRAEEFCSVRTGADGRFELFGDLERGRYHLRIDAEDHFHVETPDLRRDGGPTLVEMERKARVLGTVLAPEWMRRERVHVDLVPKNVPNARPGEAKPRNDRLHDHKGRTYAYFDWVRPGTYDLAFRLQGYPDPFLRIDHLVLLPGQHGLHPRLCDLDLGAYIFRFEIHPVDENGQPVEVDRPQLTRVTRSDGRQQWIGLVMKGRVGEVFSTTQQLEVLPMATGYVADRQVLAPGRSEVVYRRVPPVELTFAGLAALSADVEVQVLLERLELDGRPQELESFDGMSKRIANWYARARFTSATLGVDDQASIAVTAGGPHRVLLRFGVGQKIRPPTVELDAVEVEVTPGGSSPRIAVPFDLPVVQQAIADARQRLAQRQNGR